MKSFLLYTRLNLKKKSIYAHFLRLFYLLAPRMWVPRDQTQPGSFSWERKEPENEVGYNAVARSRTQIPRAHATCQTQGCDLTTVKVIDFSAHVIPKLCASFFIHLRSGTDRLNLFKLTTDWQHSFSLL